MNPPLIHLCFAVDVVLRILGSPKATSGSFGFVSITISHDKHSENWKRRSVENACLGKYRLSKELVLRTLCSIRNLSWESKTAFRSFFVGSKSKESHENGDLPFCRKPVIVIALRIYGRSFISGISLM
ncbi:MAG: hypothetical protein ACLUDY_10645 [Bacteroides xylanisolvens]